MDNLKIHIRHILLWEFNQGNHSNSIAKKICQIYGKDSISDRAVRNWFTRFRNGDMSLQDKPRVGRPSDMEKNILEKLIAEDPNQSIRSLAKKMETSSSTVQRQLKKMGKVSKSGKWVSRKSDSNHSKKKRSKAGTKSSTKTPTEASCPCDFQLKSRHPIACHPQEMGCWPNGTI